MLRLREYTAADADRLMELANNERVSRYLVSTFPFPYRLEDAWWWIAKGARENGGVNKVIEYRGEFVGNIGIVPQAGWRGHVAELGYWLGEAYWGRGLATQAVAKMCDAVFSAGGHLKLIAPVLAPNAASRRVLEKNDFALEGVLKQEVFKSGAYFDLYHYARLNV